MSNLSKLVAEALGTFALCFIGGGAICLATQQGAGYEGLLGIAAAHGLVLSIAICATMNISGGHLNPAVTFSMLLTKRIDLPGAIQYIIAQLIGGTIAGFLLLVIFHDLVVTGGGSVATACGLGTPAFNPDSISALKAMFIEAMMTFMLAMAVFTTAVDPRAPKIGGFGIGLTLGVCILFSGPLTGAALNPARTFGTGIVAAMSGHLPQFWSQHAVYWVGPIIGASLAALIYDALLAERKSS